jgi:DNA-3-methyladenine glycosylase I
MHFVYMYVFQNAILTPMEPLKNRCAWVASSGPLDQEYHDTEWGVPLYDDQKLFEFLCLEGAQAGLSWSTILKKRENYRAAFSNFDVDKVARYSETKCASLLTNPGMVRNRLKVHAFIKNAKAYQVVQKEWGDFATYIWSFVDHTPIQNNWKSPKQIPSSTEIAENMSKDLKKRGFTFVGPTICYAFMQATGMVNDHTIDCFRCSEVQK